MRRGRQDAGGTGPARRAREEVFVRLSPWILITIGLALSASCPGRGVAADEPRAIIAQEGAARPRSDLPSPLPPGIATDPGRQPRQPNAVPPPVPITPTILDPNVRPIDLTTALRLANVANPELNLARQLVLEASALRLLAAAQIIPTLNIGANYDGHQGVLQQSNGNILSVNRSAVYVGAGANAIAAGTVNI